jgi:hypothetical protein
MFAPFISFLARQKSAAMAGTPRKNTYLGAFHGQEGFLGADRGDFPTSFGHLAAKSRGDKARAPFLPKVQVSGISTNFKFW